MLYFLCLCLWVKHFYFVRVAVNIHHQTSWVLWHSFQIHLEWPAPGTSSQTQNTWGLTEQNASAASIRDLLSKWHLMEKKTLFFLLRFPNFFIHFNEKINKLPSMCRWYLYKVKWTNNNQASSLFYFPQVVRLPCTILPLPMSICRGCTGRSAKLSPWFTRASFTTLNPFNTTIQPWPIRKLNTFPCFSASCK